MPRQTPSTSRQRKRTHSAIDAQGRRVVIVWASLLGAMTAVAGGLLMLDWKPVPRMDGLSLSPLAAATSTGSKVDPVLRTRSPLDVARWQAIVVHHSGSVVGTAATISREHEDRGIKGLGHHFVIGNGQGMDDGQLHIGYRWLDQLPGAHAVGPNGDWFNLQSVSICLVGDGDRRPFTQAQVARLRELVAVLCREMDIPADRVYLHSQIAPVSDPGRLFPPDAIAIR
ncbi:MAG: N-acetylmuramoyl-L-alanine amidase [Phycisphaeraceae bacterium]|nr:N-acetylmuramoyl-L-alanine amidase [Phycisphaeraceae bacterium]